MSDPPADPAARSTLGTRLWAALLLLAAAGVLALAGYLRPDARGWGTHQQLGFAPCGMIVAIGLPCPACGMTTAFAYTVRGQVVRAFVAQPAGLVLALATIALLAGALWTLLTGCPPRLPLTRPLSPLLVFTLLLALLLGGWGFKLLVGWASGELPIARVAL